MKERRKSFNDFEMNEISYRYDSIEVKIDEGPLQKTLPEQTVDLALFLP